MITFFDDDSRRLEIKRTLYRVSLRLFSVYLVLSGVQVTGLFNMNVFLQLDLFIYGSLAIGVPLLAFDVDRGNLPSAFEKGIQFVFLISLLALTIAFSSASILASSTPFVNTRGFLHGSHSLLLLIAVCTGVLTIVSVRSNEVRVPLLVPNYHCQVLGKDVSLQTLATVLSLGAILVFYFSIRWPFMSDTFGGVIHSDKYATHVPILQEMYRTGDPFYFQNPAYTSMFDQSSYDYDSYGKVPIFSLGVLPLMFLERQFGIEFVVRSFVTIQGSLLLVILFFFLRQLFDTRIALVGTLLLAVNPLFNLVSFLTVMDLPALVLGFASIVLYWKNEKTYSYLLCGLAALTKYSFLLITVPTLAILILMNETEKFYNALKLGYFTLAPILIFRTLVVPLPGDSVFVGLLRLFSFAVLLGASVLVVERYEASFVRAVSRVDQRHRHILMIAIPVIGLALLWNLITKFAAHFLTDRYLLFNVDVYITMLNLIRGQMPRVVFYFFPVGVLWILLKGDKKARTTIGALIFGAAFYGALASKSVFIHTYYKHVFVFVGIFGFLGVFEAIRLVDFSQKIRVPAAVALTLLLVLSSQAASVALLDDDIQGTEKMGEYIDDHVPDSELVLFTQSHPRLMAIYSNTKFTHPMYGEKQAKLESEIEKKGFGSALYDRNVTYYLSQGPIETEELDQLFTGGVQTHERRTYILSEINTSDSPSPSSRNFSVKEFFDLKARFGDWYLYRIQSEAT